MKKCIKKCDLDTETRSCKGCGRTIEEIKEAYHILIATYNRTKPR